jgi:hypothetical protein
MPLGDRGDLAQLVARIVVHRDRLIVRLKSDNADEASDSETHYGAAGSGAIVLMAASARGS